MSLTVRHFTDPACPFAFSALPALRRLDWLYGDALRWEPIMVVLSTSAEEPLRAGFTPERQAAAFERLRDRHGMPIDASPRRRVMPSVEACRAVVAARRHAPERARALVRAIAVRYMAGEPLDAPETEARAARDVGIDPEALRRWRREPETAAALEEDMRAARSPLPAARALDHKLAGPPEERRYTCPSLELVRDDGVARVVPGFNPIEAYEVAIANLAPELPRRADPEDVESVLAWAGEPLATAEVAAVLNVSTAEARQALARIADLRPVGTDGYWTPRRAALAA